MGSDAAAQSERWVRWHDDYDDPTSALTWRLGVVQRRFRDALDAAPAGRIRVLSLCAGQGRDVLPVIADHPRRGDVDACLVELDPVNASYAAELARRHELAQVEMRCADAGDASASAGAVTADVLLLCGIFGNISDDDVERTVRNCSRLCAPGAVVLWTRHRKEPDLTVDIRRWFGESGFEAIGFDSQDTTAIGTERLVAEPLPYDAGLRFFAFVD